MPRDRVRALQASLDDGEAVVCYPGPNARYLAGVYGEPLDRHFLLVVPASGEPWVVTPRKSLDLLREGSSVEDARILEANDPAAVARRLVAELPAGIETVRLDDRTPFSVSEPLRTSLEGATVTSAAPLLADLRLRKDDEAVAALQRSAAVADAVSEAVRAMGEAVVGLTEAELADEIRSRLHARGGTRLSFPVVVAAGPNAARPYRRNGERTIRAGEPVILDFGAFVDGYASDQTRTTVFAGDPPEGFEAAHETVREAFEAGVAAVEPGSTAADVHRATTDVLVGAGYEDQVVHGTGHGVGLEAHEAPAVDDGSDVTLEPGMVFSVEPGLYVEGEWGVRIEDLVVVTEGGTAAGNAHEGGAERLNDSPKTWEPL